MADKEIGDLTDGGEAQEGDLFHAVRGGNSRKVTFPTPGGGGLDIEALMALTDPATATEGSSQLTVDVEGGEKLYFAHTLSANAELQAPSNWPDDFGVTFTLEINPNGFELTFNSAVYVGRVPTVTRKSVLQIQRLANGKYTVARSWVEQPYVAIVRNEAPTGTGTSLVFDVSAVDIQEGDLLVAVIGIDPSWSALTPPSGFSTITGTTASGNGAIQAKIATSTEVEASSLTWSWTTAQERAGSLLVIRGHNGSSWLSIAGDATATSAAPTAPSVLVPHDDTMILRFFVTDDDDTPYAQNDSFASIRVRANLAPTTEGPGVFGGEHYQDFRGYSGTFTFSMNASEDHRVFTVAVR
jgi:hypothetical protein